MFSRGKRIRAWLFGRTLRFVLCLARCFEREYLTFTDDYEAKMYNNMASIKSADETFPGILKSMQNYCFSILPVGEDFFSASIDLLKLRTNEFSKRY